MKYTPLWIYGLVLCWISRTVSEDSWPVEKCEGFTDTKQLVKGFFDASSEICYLPPDPSRRATRQGAALECQNLAKAWGLPSYKGALVSVTSQTIQNQLRDQLRPLLVDSQNNNIDIGEAVFLAATEASGVTSWRWTNQCPSCDHLNSCVDDKLDLSLVVDESGSICGDNAVNGWCDNWGEILDFLKHLLIAFTVGPGHTQVAVVTFGNQARVKSTFTQHNSMRQIQDFIANLKLAAEKTNTSGALETLAKELYGSKDDRPEARNVAIVITDGKSTNSAQTSAAARKLREMQVDVYAIGVTPGVTESEIRDMSKMPQTENQTYWLIKDFESLESFKLSADIGVALCGESDTSHNRRTPLTSAKHLVQEQGCYQGPDHSLLDDVTAAIGPSSMTVTLCLATCADKATSNSNYTYAVLRGGSKCLCGQNYDKQVLSYSIVDNGCYSSCQGNSSQQCGGPNQDKVYFLKGQYVKWKRGQPNSARTYEPCGAVLRNDQNGAYELEDASCSNLYGYICEVDMSKCSMGNNQYYRGEHNRCYLPSTNRLSWFSARYSCLLEGGALATLDNIDIHSEVLTIIQNRIAYNTWVGLAGKLWAWGETGNNVVEYTNWQPDRPTKESYTCMGMNSQFNRDWEWYQWTDLWCSSHYAYFCQIDMSEKPSTSMAPVTTVLPSTDVITTEMSFTPVATTSSGTTVTIPATTVAEVDTTDITTELEYTSNTPSQSSSNAQTTVTQRAAPTEMSSTPGTTPVALVTTVESVTTETTDMKHTTAEPTTLKETLTDSATTKADASTSTSKKTTTELANTMQTTGEGTTMVAESVAPPVLLASTENNGGLGTFEIVMIILIALLVFIILLIVVLFCVYKRANPAGGGAVKPSKVYDARPVAPIPGGDGIYLPPPDSSDTAGLIWPMREM